MISSDFHFLFSITCRKINDYLRCRNFYILALADFILRCYLACFFPPALQINWFLHAVVYRFGSNLCLIYILVLALIYF
jgi:uncharacterized membrane protein YciS (DUF1049 family)